MKKYIFLALSLLFIETAISCNDFLDYQPRGVLSESDVVTPKNVDGFVNAAYSC